MAHYAELDENNVVIKVLVVNESDTLDESGNENESIAAQYLNNIFQTASIWKKTSYNTRSGVYFDPISNLPSNDQTKSFRKNYAGIGYTYDSTRDAFIPPIPEGQGWILDEITCIWKNPEQDELVKITTIGVDRV